MDNEAAGAKLCTYRDIVHRLSLVVVALDYFNSLSSTGALHQSPCQTSFNLTILKCRAVPLQQLSLCVCLCVCVMDVVDMALLVQLGVVPQSLSSTACRDQ